MRPRLGFSFNRKSFFAKAQNPQWWHAPWPPARAVALHEVRVEAGWLLPPGGGWVPWWVPWCLGACEFQHPEFVGVPFFLVAPQKNGKFRFFLWLWWQHGFFCWVDFDKSTHRWCLALQATKRKRSCAVGFLSDFHGFPKSRHDHKHHHHQPITNAPPPSCSQWRQLSQLSFHLGSTLFSLQSDFSLRLRLPLHGQNHGPNPQELIWTYSYQQPFLPAGAHRAVPQPQSAVASTSE